MNLFPLTASYDNASQENLGFINNAGDLVIRRKDISHLSSFNRFGYCVLSSGSFENRREQIIDQDNRLLLTLPENHNIPWMHPPDGHGIFAAKHELDKKDSTAYTRSGREAVYVGRTRYYAMNLNGEVVFEEKIGQGANGYYELRRPTKLKGQKRLGIINHLGEITVPAEFDDMLWSRTDPLVTVLRNGLLGVIDYYGREVIPISLPVKSFTDMRFVSNGILAYYDPRQDVCHTVNMEGDLLARIPLTYDSPTLHGSCPWLSDGLMLIKEKNKEREGPSYYRDAYGKYPMRVTWYKPIKFTPEYRVGFFYDGLATFHLNGLMGYIEKSGSVAIDAQFESTQNFTNGLAKTFRTREDKLKNRYSYINTSGEIVACNH